MKLKIRKVCLTVFCIMACHYVSAQITARPTFESCGLYYSYTVDVVNKVYYKEISDSKWKEGFSLVFDSSKNEFRGSLARLKENTDYDVKLELYNKGQLFRTVASSFKTWNSNPPIVQTLNISSFKSNGYKIDQLKGTASGWIKVVGDEPVNVLSSLEEGGINLSYCEYVIFEGITLIGGRKHGFKIESTNHDVYIVNCDISNWGRASQTTTSKGVYIDSDGNEINNDAGIHIDRAYNILVERCYIHDSKAQANPWKGVIPVGPYAGTSFSDVHPKGPNAIFVNQAQQGIVLRYNDCIGSQTHRFNDVVETAQNGYENGGFGMNADIYGNMMVFGQDDTIELDGSQNNVRCFNNRMEQTFCGISVAPNMQGPSYIFNNVIWNLGDQDKSTSAAVKSGGGISHTRGRQFFFNNTIYTSKNCISGIGYGASTGNERAKYIASTRNNILVSTRQAEDARPESSGNSSGGDGLSISDREKNPACDFDYDMIGNPTGVNGAGTIYAVDGSEANGIFAMPMWNDPNHGVFTLKYKDKGINKGVVIPNFTGDYHGEAPDMGAIEMCASSLIPIRPLDMIADKYSVKLSPGGETLKIMLYAGDDAPNSSFTIRKSEDMQWLSVSANSTEICPNSEIELSLSASSASTTYRKTGAIIVRLENGLSIPITVSAE